MSLAQRLAAALSPAARLKYGLELAAAGEDAKAFAQFAKAAAAGVTEAQFRAGRAYLDGRGVPVSRDEGARWMRRAAEGGWAEAAYVLSTLYLYGFVAPETRSANTMFATGTSARGEGEPDFDNARLWAQRAADGGSPEGRAMLGYVLTSGPESMRDLPRAEQLYRASADAGCPQGALGLGLAVLAKAPQDGEDEAAKYRQAATWLQRAAQGGRMREALRPGARSLFVVMTDTRNLQYRSFAQLHARLRQKAPDSELLAIGLNPGPPQPRAQGTLRTVERADGYRRYSFSPGAPTTDGLRFAAPGDGALLRRVFEPYSFALEAAAPEAD